MNKRRRATLMHPSAATGDRGWTELWAQGFRPVVGSVVSTDAEGNFFILMERPEEG